MSVEKSMGEMDQNHFTLDDIASTAKELTIMYGHHSPTIIVEGSKKSNIIVLEDFPQDHDEKTYQMFSIGHMVAINGGLGDLDNLFFITEGWMSIGDENHPIVNPPSQDPQRKEVLIVSKVTVKDRISSLTMFEMVRDRDGKLLELIEFQQGVDVGDTSVLNIKSPLLDAFIKGYRVGKSAKNN